MNKRQTAKNTKTSFREKLRGWWFSFYVAHRYLFSKKSHNAVNIISGISSAGICVGTIAMVCILSVFNGMESMVRSTFSTFDPALRITATQGKTFRIDTPSFDKLRNLSSVAVFTEVLEENALLMYKEKQVPAVVKGVGTGFREMTRIDDIIYDGEFLLYDGGFERIVVGQGLADRLGLGAHFIDPVYIYAPKRTERINLLRPENSFTRVGTFISGVFIVQQAQYDDNYALVSLSHARKLFEYDEYTVSAIELKLADNINNINQAKKQIIQLLGNGFNVKDQYEQQEDFYKILKMEKLVAYLILSLILLIAGFNIIGSLSMLIIDKKDDISTLRSMGADNRLIQRIFLYEGWLISIAGAIIGIVLGTLLCLGQQHFGWLKMGDSIIAEAYPVVVQIGDVLLSFATVLIMGLLTAYYPVRYIRQKNRLISN